MTQTPTNRTPTSSAGVTAPALTVAASIAAGTAAYGSPVRFENDTNFSPDFNALDITMSSAAQVGGSSASLTGTQVYFDIFSDFYPTFSYYRTDTRGNGLEIWNSGFGNFYSASFDSGDMIGAGMVGGEWNQSSRLAFSYNSADRYYVPPYYVYPYGYYGGYYIYTNYMSGERGLLGDGGQTYIGTRLTINGATHYGWIGVENFGGYIDVFAWGYETEAGVAVQAGSIPTPGALAVVALGAAGALGRRKRVA